MVMKMLRDLACAVGLVTSLTVWGFAAQNTDKPVDKEFLGKLAMANNAEILISELAEKRAGSSEVKDFATKLVKDHFMAGNKIEKLSKEHKVEKLTSLDKHSRDELDRLTKLKGAEFDHAYLECMVKAHKEVISMSENQVKNGKSDDVKALAKELLPDLRKHLSKAETLAKSTSK